MCWKDRDFDVNWHELCKVVHLPMNNYYEFLQLCVSPLDQCKVPT